MTAHDGDLTVGAEPVTNSELAHEPECVTRSRSVALRAEQVGAGLNHPAPGLERGERPALLLGRKVERVGTGAGQRVLAGGWPLADLRCYRTGVLWLAASLPALIFVFRFTSISPFT